MLFDVNTLIILIKTKKKLITSLEDSIKILRNINIFNIIKLVEENISTYPYETLYFIIYKSNEIIATSRLIYKPSSKSCYINMVFTNEKYRGNKICQNNIKKIISLTKNMFNIYELEVKPENFAAIKCYENVGFVFVKTVTYTKNGSNYILNLMKYTH
jgi:predicted GNAT family N-acyltransferase